MENKYTALQRRQDVQNVSHIHLQKAKIKEAVRFALRMTAYFFFARAAYLLVKCVMIAWREYHADR